MTSSVPPIERRTALPEPERATFVGRDLIPIVAGVAGRDGWVSYGAGMAEPPKPRLPPLNYTWAIVVGVVMFLCCAGVAVAGYLLTHSYVGDCPLHSRPPSGMCYPTGATGPVRCVVYRLDAL
jgi:hypothetical protein